MSRGGVRETLRRSLVAILVMLSWLLIVSATPAAVVSPPAVLWILTSISGMSSATVLDDLVVYVGGNYTTLFEVRLEDGAVVNEHQIGTIGTSPPAAIYDGTLVCGTLDGAIYFVYPDGSTSAPLDLGSPLRTSPAIDWRGIAYVGSDDGKLHAIDTFNSELLWSYDAGQAIRSSPAVDGAGNILFGCDDGEFRALNAWGDLLWSTPLGGRVRSSPAIGSRGEVYAGTDSGWLYALRPSDGKPWWRAKAGKFGVHSPVVDERGVIYTSSLDGTLASFDQDGQQLWIVMLEEWLIGAPCLSEDGALYVLTMSGRVKAYSRVGDLQWEVDLVSDAGWDPCPEGGECDRIVSPSIDRGVPELMLARDGVLLVTSGNQLTALATGTSGPALTGWPMFHANEQRTGSSDSPVGPQSMSLCSVDAQAPEGSASEWAVEEPGEVVPSAPPPPASPPDDLAGLSEGPTAEFVFGVLQDKLDRTEPIVFFNVSRPPVDGQITNSQWAVDGVEHPGDDYLEFQFAETGDHDVTLRVTDDSGRTAEYTETVSIPNLEPTASFAVSPSDPVVGDLVQFDAAESFDLDGEVASLAWSFVDGRRAAEGSVLEVTFTEPGTYEILLAVTDNDGATTTAERMIRVTDEQDQSATFDGERYAFVIGISEYEDDRIADLGYAAADARAFYDYAVDPDGGGFSRDLARDLIGEEASLKNIWNQVGWLLGKVSEGDVIVIYFAGHGGQGEDHNADEDDGKDEYLIPVDASSSELYSTAIRDDVLGDWLFSFESKGAQVLLVMDSCHSGGASRSLGGRTGMGGTLVDVSLDGESHIVLCASEEFEESFEDEGLQHGVFTYYLLRGLGADKSSAPEADADEDGRVTIAEVAAYLEEVVPAYVKSEFGDDKSQHPVVYGGEEVIGSVWLSSPVSPVTGRVAVVGSNGILISLDVASSPEPADRFEVLRPILDETTGLVEMEVVAVIAVGSTIAADYALCSVAEHVLPDVDIVEGLPVRAMVKTEQQ